MGIVSWSTPSSREQKPKPSFYMVLQRDGKIRSEEERIEMGALYEFFRANKVSTADNYTPTNDREYQEDNGEKPLGQVVQDARFRVSRRNQNYSFHLSEVNPREMAEFTDLSYYNPGTRHPLSQYSEEDRERLGYTEYGEIKGQKVYLRIPSNGSDKGQWTYDFTDNMIYVFGRPDRTR
jgi:hypothetical protein